MSHLSEVATRLQVYLERLKTSQVKEFNKVLIQLQAAVVAELNKADFRSLSKSDVRTVLTNLRDALEGLFDDRLETFVETLEEIAHTSYGLEATTFKTDITNISSKLSAAKVFKNVVERPMSATGDLLVPWMKNLTDNEVTTLESLLRRGYAESWDNAKILRALKGTKANRYTDGLLPRLGRQNSTIVRTAMQHAHSVARQAFWKENSDIINGYRWVSVLDSVTSDQCRALDGQEFEIDKGPLPPIHPNCRSVTVAVLSDGLSILSRGATRASMDGPVGAKTTYYQWLKSQSADFQDSVIGPVRGALLRDGGLSVSEFTRLQLNSVFEPLTLEEMRKLAPLAFRRAKL